MTAKESGRTPTTRPFTTPATTGTEGIAGALECARRIAALRMQPMSLGAQPERGLEARAALTKTPYM